MKNYMTTLVCLILFTKLASGMPPHERVVRMIQSGEIQAPIFMQNPDFFREKGINQGKPGRHLALDQPTGQFRALAILVKFSDQNSQVAGSYFDNLLYGSTGNTVKDYYLENSYGNLDIITVNLPSSLGWYTMPHNYGYYVDGNYGFNSYPNNAQKLAEDAVYAANSSVDFSDYDNDGDGTVDALFIIHSGQGAEWTGDVNDIWSHAWECFLDPYVDGVWVNGYSMEPEYWSSPNDMTCGVYAHELGHVFGLPDFYDYGYDSRGLGSWSVMAFGSWNGNSGNTPAQFDAYSRVFLGFAEAINITENLASVTIPAVEDTGFVYRLWTNGQMGNEYYLIENRQQVGFDANIPSNGLCIYHIDESVYGNDNQWYPGYTDFGHYQAALEQADGDWDLEQNSNSGDSGDPFPGASNNRAFNNTSTPNSKDYDFNNTYIAVTNISNSGMTMTADLAVANAPASPTLISPANGSATNNFRPTFDFSNSAGATVYHIQIDDNFDFSSPIHNISNLSTSQFTPGSNLPEAILYWRARAGNGTAWSTWSPSWTVIIDATPPASPTNLTANGSNPSAWTNNSAFIINWINPSDLSGLQRAHFKLGNPPSSNNDTSFTRSFTPPQTVNSAVEGGIDLYIWLRDNAGNANYQNRAQVRLNYDATRPAGCMSDSPDTSDLGTFTVNWSEGNDSGGSGLAGLYDIWYRVDNGIWSLYEQNITATSMTFYGSQGHSYGFEALNHDNAGNIEDRSGNAESNTVVDTSFGEGYMPGDANNNGQVNGLDVIFLVNFLKGLGPEPSPLLSADTNGDCLVNGIDVVYLVNFLKGGPAPQRGDCR